MHVIQKINIEGTGFATLWVCFTFIAFYNILTIGSPLGILISIPQYIIVLKNLFSGDIRNAVLLHFAFILLSVSSQGVYGMFDTQNFSMYNYGTIKLIGPIRACYLINILMVFIIVTGNRKQVRKTLYSRLFNIMLYLAISGIIVGFGGLLLNPYYSFMAMMDNCIYMFVLLSSMYILLHMMDEGTVKSAYYICLIVIMVGPVVGALGYSFLHITSSYGMYDIVVNIESAYFGALLIYGLLYVRQKTFLYFSIIAFLYVSFFSIGGKSIFGIAFCFMSLAYILIFDKETKLNYPKSSRILRPCLIVLLIFIVPILLPMLGDSFAAYKLTSALSMFSGNLDDISRSPFIRVASLINILYEGIQNPLVFLFGNGYGGYFEDHFNYFVGLDLEKGAWGAEEVATGRFHSGHDTMVSVPLFNGFIGVCLLIKICWQYIKRIKYNYLGAVAFLWILLVFYSNTILAYVGVFLLFASEYNLGLERYTSVNKNEDTIS